MIRLTVILMSVDLCSLSMFRIVSACTGSAATGIMRWWVAASARRDMSKYQWTASPVTRKVRRYSKTKDFL